MSPVKFIKKRRVTKKKRIVKPSKGMIKAIQSIVHKDAETKHGYHNHALTAYNGDVNVADILRVFPNIVVGSDDNQRIGSKIKATMLRIKGHMILTASLAPGFCKVAVRLMLVQPRATLNYNTLVGTTVGATWLSGLLEKGATSVGYSGSISDLYANIDKDTTQIYYDKIHYISQPQLLTVTGVLDTRQTVSFFNINLKINKNILYNDTIDSTQPQNCNPVLLMGYTYLDGTAPGVNTNVSIALDSYLDYQDS